jgi:pimeloyl-ACP methyl ester carboxylesterase
MSMRFVGPHSRFLTSWILTSFMLCGAAHAEVQSPGKERPGDFSIPFVRNVPKNQSVIVFVHGVVGDAKSTWSDGTHYWPAMLRDDPAFDGQNIYVYEYPSPILGRALSVDQLADNMRLVLSTDGVLKHQSITFVSHSMGGLITRAFILKYRQTVAPKIRLLYFFGTPTTGSPYATLAKLVSRNQQFGEMYPMSADTDSYLGVLQSNWLAANLGLKSYCGYETLPTYGLGIIVDRQSATNLCTERLDPIDADHIQIVKPSGSTSTSYRALKNAIQETAPAGEPHARRTKPNMSEAPKEALVPLHTYDFTGRRGEVFLALLDTQLETRDTLRVGCIGWIEDSCVAAGKFLISFSQAGWRIDSNRVFRFDPGIPPEGMTIASKSPRYTDNLPPHLGHWGAMDASQVTFWRTFAWMQIPVGASGDPDMPEGTIGIYFGPEPKNVSVRTNVQAQQQLAYFMGEILIELRTVERTCSTQADTCKTKRLQWTKVVSALLDYCDCGLNKSWSKKWSDLSKDTEDDPSVIIDRQDKALEHFINTLNNAKAKH